MTIKSNPCKECGSIFHTKMHHTPRKPLKRTAIKRTSIKTSAPKSTAKKQKAKKVTRGQLVKKLDAAYSQYVRLKDARMLYGQLRTVCVTCGDRKPWKQHQNGHFYTRGRYATRWDDNNCHVQCMPCNVFLSGNYINYTMYMIDRYGREAVEQLEIKSKSTIKLSTSDLQEMTDDYKTKVKELLDA